VIGWINFGRKSKHPLKQLVGFGIRMWGKKDAPELSIPEMQPVSDALKTPLSVSPKTIENKTQNNSYNINVQASPNQDSKAVADEVMRRLKSAIAWGLI
jgi:hypothetical protein